MAGLSISSRDSGKDQMLERYLNLMAEQRQRQEATVSTAPQIAQKIEDVEEAPQATQQVSKSRREHEEWKETTTKSQETYWNLLDLAEGTGSTILVAKGSRGTEKLQANFQQPSSNLLDFQEESGLIDLSSPRKFKEPEESQAYHEESNSTLLDLVKVVSDVTELSSPGNPQEIDVIQEAEYNQDTEENEESEADPEDDDQCGVFPIWKKILRLLESYPTSQSFPEKYDGKFGILLALKHVT
ncbi:hypothetical protein BOTCAL_0006g00130 [Botryotinia calthae]|uniref:Uncharacterized protein n=1 Tax=Botryotinia calthae TaxID=38488 RepID=A0A4Y8DGZ1_9HELO|nr:hypothetical protein BOTCAL_0006g00130 [Botryotinia calthae]